MQYIGDAKSGTLKGKDQYAFALDYTLGFTANTLS